MTSLADNATHEKQNILPRVGIRPKTERQTVEETIKGVKNLTSSVKKKLSKVLLGINETFSSEMFLKKSTKKSLRKTLKLKRKS